MAQLIHLPTSQGLYVLADCPRQVRMDENVLLTWGVNNYLGRALSNVNLFRIRSSNDFELMEASTPEHVISMKDKDYTYTIPSLRSFGVETYSMIWVPKRSGLIQIVIEVKSEFGGIRREELSARLFDLTSDKETFGSMAVKINDSPALRKVRLSVSGTDLDHFIKQNTTETNTLVADFHVVVFRVLCDVLIYLSYA